jgi:glycine/D-amino acid oxidase-like deaminating enzyme/nitrite reductase/ring-hydroxylating ferredoxin subunit
MEKTLKTDSGQSISAWMATTPVSAETPLDQNTNADVCVIGAGIAGLSTAYLLAKEGQSVVVLDDGPAGRGMTARTTAHLSNAVDDRYFEIERLHGEEGAHLAAKSHTTAIDQVEQIVKQEQIACDFERLDGYLFVPPRQSRKLLDDELAAAHRAGLSDVEKVARAPLSSYDTGPALRFPKQAQFHPLKYLTGMLEAIKRMGGRLYVPAHASEITGGKRGRVKTSGGFAVECKAIVVATNTPINDLVAIHTKQAPYQTYVVAARIPRGSVTKALYWDTNDPYHYVRVQRIGRGSNAYDLLIVGGEDHKTGQSDDGNKRLNNLERWTRVRFPMVEDFEYRWSGEVMEPADAVAFIGRNPLDADNVFIATGDSGQGMTHGTIAGMLLRDLILGRDNAWAKLYDPARITLKALPKFAKENLNVALQYTEYIRKPDVQVVDEIQPGSGAVVLKDGLRVAAYRDEAGVLYERSAVCRHLGCVVNWNSLEKTWDCPCHGSRYTAYGQVFQGPANDGLPEAESSLKKGPPSIRRRHTTAGAQKRVRLK